MVAQIDLVLPCLDEVTALPWVLERVPSGVRAIVVDNGSSDGSAAAARGGGALVVPCATRGYGAACHAGLLAADAPLVAFCDCDGTLDPGDVLRLAETLRDRADLVLGRRRATTRAAWPLVARLANRELARRVRKRTRTRIHDVSPLRIADRSGLIALNLRDRRFGYPVETVVRAADAGWRIDEVEVDYHPRIGTSKVTGTIRGYLGAVHDMSAVLKS